MDLGLAGKCIIVTGASRGIGLSIAESCAKEGARVAICGRSQSSLDAAAEQLNTHGGKVVALTCDVSDPAALDDFLKAAQQALGGLDGLVNNPSGFGHRDDEESWRINLDVDLLGVVRGTRFAARVMNSGGSIVNMSSTSGIGASSNIAYGAAKAAVIQATQSYALKLAGKRIRVNAIAPGSIEFPDGIWDKRRQHEPESYHRTLAKIPFGRMGRPEEIGRTAAFLLSDAASWITGQTIAVDGGQNL